jgi:uncharacterized protein
MKNSPLQICNITIQPGERLTLALPTPEIYTCAPMHIPVHVIHGKKAGPTLLICAAIHGDEVNGVAIIHKLLNLKSLKSINGTLIAVPVVNIYGLIAQSRNLPDRRDLEGAFPGNETGSFASRLAYLFTNEILSKATHIIDIHTGEPYYNKLPQIHTFLNEKTEKIAKAFAAPVTLNNISSRSLLWLMHKDDSKIVMLYEAGQALQVQDLPIKAGIKGILNVMRKLKMIAPSKIKTKTQESLVIKNTSWIRAPGSGICRLYKKLGSYVRKGDLIAGIIDPFGTEQKYKITSPCNGIIITENTLSLVNEGESLFQIALTSDSEKVLSQIESLENKEQNY